ncbi:MAG: radical SAM protein [Spirochaetota bacterium]|nr:MAG: radical SAM protein [Spirochaetota bacterium]
MITYIERKFKSILIKRKYIDSWFWDRYGINPYNGCQFGCIYCDSRSAKYHLPTDFENTIIIKQNVREMLDQRLNRARTLIPDVVGIAGACDPYQPAEKKYRNTRSCLEILINHSYPVHIITKSPLVLEDRALLEGIGKQSWCTVSVTITTINKERARFLEYRAPDPESRFKIIRGIKDNASHIQVGVLIIPIIPFLTDSKNELEELVKASKVSGADYILFGSGLTMRDKQALWFLRHLRERYPEVTSNYENLYRFTYDPALYRGTYQPLRKYVAEKNLLMKNLCEKHSLACRIKRYIPDDYRKQNYRIAEHLLNQSYENQISGKTWTNIFWAGMNIQNLKEPIEEIAKRGDLKTVRNVNESIEGFIYNNI